MYCVHLPWGSLWACLATHKTMEKPRMETFYFFYFTFFTKRQQKDMQQLCKQIKTLESKKSLIYSYS